MAGVKIVQNTGEVVDLSLSNKCLEIVRSGVIRTTTLTPPGYYYNQIPPALPTLYSGELLLFRPRVYSVGIGITKGFGNYPFLFGSADILVDYIIVKSTSTPTRKGWGIEIMDSSGNLILSSNKDILKLNKVIPLATTTSFAPLDVSYGDKWLNLNCTLGLYATLTGPSGISININFGNILISLADELTFRQDITLSSIPFQGNHLVFSF